MHRFYIYFIVFFAPAKKSSVLLKRLIYYNFNQTRNPHAVQPHLRKCFDAIAKLEFGVKLPESEMVITEEGALVEREMSFQTRDMLQAKLAKTAKQEDLTTDIIAMLSPEGERVNLGKVRKFTTE